jgi:hypothetical protein
MVVGQGSLAFVGSAALGFLVLEYIFGSVIDPTEMGFPDYRVLVVIVAATVMSVIGFYLKFKIWKPALVGGAGGVGIVIIGIIVIVAYAFIGYIAAGPP